MGITSTTAVLNVRADTGSDNNAGAFDPATPNAGTDLTYPTSIALSRTGLAPVAGMDGVIQCASNPFTRTLIGNYLNTQSGTGWIPGRSRIADVDAATGYATMDQSPFVGVGNAVATYTVGLRGDGGYRIGMKFTVGASALTVQKLGRYIASGSTHMHRVFLQDVSLAVVAQVDVDTTLFTAGTIGYVALGSPVVLTAGASYYLTSYEMGTGDSWNDNHSIALTSDFVSAQSAYFSTSDQNAVGTGFSVGGTGSAYNILDMKYLVGTTLATPGSDGAGIIGGAMATLEAACTVMALGNDIYLGGSGTVYTPASAPTPKSGSGSGTAFRPSRIMGYGSVRGDGGRPIVRRSSGTVFNHPGTCQVSGIEFDGVNGGSGGQILTPSSSQAWFSDCVFTRLRCPVLGVYSDLTLINCELHHNSDSGGDFEPLIRGGSGGFQFSIERCHIHDNTASGLISAANTGHRYVHNVIVNNNMRSTGSAAIAAAGDALVEFNTFYNNIGGGVYVNVGSIFGGPQRVRNNVFHSCTGKALWGDAVSPLPYQDSINGNAFYNNAMNRDTTIGSLMDTLDVLCTSDPLINAAGGDYRLNSTAGGGLSIRGRGVPLILAGLTNNRDMGAFQHADPTGGGGSGGGGSVVGSGIVLAGRGSR